MTSSLSAAPSSTEMAQRASSSHHNVVTLTGAAIKSLHYNQQFVITDDQPSTLPPTITQSGNVWSVDFYCGRKKSADVAQSFNARVGGAHHMFNPGSKSDRTPDELNFYGGLTVGLDVNGMVSLITLYVGQGSNNDGNNWWIGGHGVGNHGRAPVIVPMVTLSDNLAQVFEITSSSDNTFDLGAWFSPMAPNRDQPDWLARMSNEDMTIDAINLPGTHDSAAIRISSARSFYSCHDTSLTQQMLSGVRLFDLRISAHLDNGVYTFMTCHGKIGVEVDLNEYQTVSSAMDEFRHFLNAHPREFLALSLKVDDWNSMGQKHHAAALDALYDLIEPYPIMGRPDLPTLGEVRGKIYLLNRLNDEVRFGPPIHWKDNTAGSLHHASPPQRTFALYVQDQYKDLDTLGSTAEKYALWEAAEKEVKPGQLLLNYASATWYGVEGVYIMGDVLNFFGQSPAAARPALLGWSLFDYENTVYLTAPYHSATVVELLIDSNFGYEKYPLAFQVDK